MTHDVTKRWAIKLFARRNICQIVVVTQDPGGVRVFQGGQGWGTQVSTVFILKEKKLPDDQLDCLAGRVQL